jgi:S1-C subfamily serine protease
MRQSSGRPAPPPNRPMPRLRSRCWLSPNNSRRWGVSRDWGDCGGHASWRASICPGISAQTRNAGFIHDPEGKIAKIDESAYPSTPVIDTQTPDFLFREARASIGQIEAHALSKDGASIVNQGTCFILSKDGYALTSAHLVDAVHVDDPSTSISVRLGSIASPSQQARVLKIEKDGDIAIIKMTATIDYKPLRISRQQPGLGESVAVIGFPLQNDLTILLGSELMPSDANGMMQIAAPASLGQSGSPILNKNGEVVGILSGGYLKRPGVVAAIPITRALALLATFGIVPN